MGKEVLEGCDPNIHFEEGLLFLKISDECSLLRSFLCVRIYTYIVAQYEEKPIS